jgi:hypothetical protein
MRRLWLAILFGSLVLWACSSGTVIPAPLNESDSGGSSTASASGGSGASANNSGGTLMSPSSGGAANQLTGGTPSTGGMFITLSSGGTSTTLTGGTATALTGGTTSSGAAPNYWSSSPWQGYAWVGSSGTGTTITPANFDAHTAGSPFCVSGSVAATSDYSGTAMIGFNINQAEGASTVGTWTPTSVSSGGVQVSVTNTGGSPLRIQIQGPNGGTDATQRWCANLTGSGGLIPWTSFNTACWDNSGSYYAGEPLAAVLVLVPGGNSAAVSYNFCVSGLGVSGSGGGGTGGTSSTGNTGGTTGAGGASGNYYTSGVWQGYAWVGSSGTGTTITPADFATHTPGTPFCVSGSVAATSDYSGTAMIGFNINQAEGATAVGTWTPASTSSGGVQVNVTNAGGSPLRLQIQGATGGTDATQRWCATLTGSGLVAWSSFNTACWDGTGTAYSGQPIAAVLVLVPGGNTTAVSYNFCIVSVAPA